MSKRTLNFDYMDPMDHYSHQQTEEEVQWTPPPAHQPRYQETRQYPEEPIAPANYDEMRCFDEPSSFTPPPYKEMQASPYIQRQQPAPFYGHNNSYSGYKTPTHY